MPSMKETMDIGVRAGNASMHAAGRTSWAPEDFDAAEVACRSALRLADDGDEEFDEEFGKQLRETLRLWVRYA